MALPAKDELEAVGVAPIDSTGMVCMLWVSWPPAVLLDVLAMDDATLPFTLLPVLDCILLLLEYIADDFRDWNRFGVDGFAFR